MSSTEKKSMGARHRKLLAIVCGALVCAPGCSSNDTGGFAIYLTKDNTPPEQMRSLSHIEVLEEPIISSDDIVAYDRVTHEMELTLDARERLVELEVPVSGTSFVVCVDSQPVYPGAFWVLYSSLVFEGVTIYKPLSMGDPTPVQLQLGYPSMEFYNGEDPRNAPDVLRALEEEGKLEAISYASTRSLPHSMKGYELYSWQDDGEWHYTFISGTNRNKNAEETTSPTYIVTEDGWVQLHARGIEAVKAAFNRLPPGESVCWLSALTASNDDVIFALPPQCIIDEVIARAAVCGVELRVAPGN